MAVKIHNDLVTGHEALRRLAARHLANRRPEDAIKVIQHIEELRIHIQKLREEANPHK